jgi:hypothetical protein
MNPALKQNHLSKFDPILKLQVGTEISKYNTYNQDLKERKNTRERNNIQVLA